MKLRRIQGDPSTNGARLLGELGERLPSMRRSGLRSFFFMRKLPDLRLRFASRAGSQWAGDHVSDLLEDLKRRRVVSSWFASCYEPEVHQLGGPGVVDMVHDHFDTDSRGYLAWSALQGRGEARLSAEVISLAILNDLFFRVVSGTEVWDVWRNVEAVHGVSPTAGGEKRVAAIRVADVIGAVSPDEARILDSYSRRNEQMAAGLERLWRRGRLLYGRRSVLPFIALWHWNRWGFDAARRARVYRPMVATLDPRAGLHGQEPS